MNISDKIMKLTNQMISKSRSSHMNRKLWSEDSRETKIVEFHLIFYAPQVKAQIWI